MDRKKAKLEAAIRLSLLNLQKVKRELIEEDVIYFSEPVKMGNRDVGVLYWLDNQEELVKAVENFEKEHDAYVYHAVYNNTGIGRMLSLLFVGADEEEWGRDKADIKNKDNEGVSSIFSYVVNLDNELFSEYGYIGVKSAAGGLVRKY